MKFIPAAAALVLTSASSVSAADLYWGSSTSFLWQSAGNWFQDADGTLPASAFPGAADHAIFSIDSLKGTAIAPVLNAHLLVNGITFENTVALTATGTGGNRNLAIGSGGITLSSTASNVTLGTATSSRNIFVKIQEDQTWTNNSSATLQIRNSSQASDTASGPVVLTLNAASSGVITNSGAFSDGAAGSLGLVVDSAGSGLVQMASSTYSGGTTIKRGILQVNGGTAGTAAVRLGDTTGSANATLRVNSSISFGTNLIAQAGSAGSRTLEFNSTSGGSMHSTITLDASLNFAVRGGQTVTMDGAISGTGSLVKSQYQGGNSGTLLLNAVNTYSGNTTVSNGTLTLSDNAALTFTIGANGVNNRIDGTAIVNLDGDFIFNLGGAEALSGNSWQIVNVATLTETFGATFSVQGFTESGNVWTNGAGYSFDEATGVLSYAAIPEPTAIVLACAGLAVLALRRRRSGRGIPQAR